MENVELQKELEKLYDSFGEEAVKAAVCGPPRKGRVKDSRGAPRINRFRDAFVFVLVEIIRAERPRSVSQSCDWIVKNGGFKIRERRGGQLWGPKLQNKEGLRRTYGRAKKLLETDNDFQKNEIDDAFLILYFWCESFEEYKAPQKASGPCTIMLPDGLHIDFAPKKPSVFRAGIEKYKASHTKSR